MDRREAGFEIVDHTADLGLRGWAPDFSSLLEVMARALFEVIVDPETVTPGTMRPLALRADTPEDLLHDWLEELNALHQIHHELYGAFRVRAEGGMLEAELFGEPIDPARHDLRLEVKAVTWHGLSLTRTPEGLTAYVLLDI